MELMDFDEGGDMDLRIRVKLFDNDSDSSGDEVRLAVGV